MLPLHVVIGRLGFPRSPARGLAWFVAVIEIFVKGPASAILAKLNNLCARSFVLPI